MHVIHHVSKAPVALPCQLALWQIDQKKDCTGGTSNHTRLCKPLWSVCMMRTLHKRACNRLGCDRRLFNGFIRGGSATAANTLLYWAVAATTAWGCCCAAAGVLKPSMVITHVLPLDDAPKGYELFNDKKDGCVKVVLQPGATEARYRPPAGPATH